MVIPVVEHTTIVSLCAKGNSVKQMCLLTIFAWLIESLITSQIHYSKHHFEAPKVFLQRLWEVVR